MKTAKLRVINTQRNSKITKKKTFETYGMLLKLQTTGQIRL